MENDNLAAPIALPAREFPLPDRRLAARDLEVNVVHNDNFVTQEQAYLQEETNDPSQCYLRWPDKVPVPLGNNGDKGEVVFCQVLLRDRTNAGIVFRQSDFSVAVKKIRRWKVDPHLEKHRRGEGPIVLDNPYNEIYVMQQYGNDENVMCCHEALYDKKYLYIVMLNAREGDLLHHVKRGVGPNEIVDIVKMLVVNLQYLQRHHLIHRDVKLENCVVRSPWIPFIDFAMTVQAGVIEGQPKDVLYQGRCGTASHISPEMHCMRQRRPFNYKCDVWAIGVTLWRMLTGMTLYDEPMNTDWSFHFLIRQGVLSSVDKCNDVLGTLTRPTSDEEVYLKARIQAALKVPDVTRDLMSKMLQEHPAQRASLEDILNHPFFQQAQQG